MFSRIADAKEVDLINKVAAIIDPGAFDRRPLVGPPADQQAFERVQENNRERAREIAMEVIATIRESI